MMPTLRCRDIDIYYERHGSGPTVLSISGSGGDLRQNPTRGEGPLERAFDTVMYDQRGLGQTTIPEGPYTMAAYADDAATLLDGLGVDRCHVVGTSFGGMVAQEFVLRHPDRVNRLVLACTSSGGDGGSSWDLLALDGLTGDERMRAWLPRIDSRNDWTTTPPTVAPGFQGILGYLQSRPQPTGEAARGSRLQLEARFDHDTWERLPTITAPTLCIGGRFDQQAPPENMERLAGRIPGARLAFCDGGHMFMIQDPAAWPTIVAFLQE